MIVAHQRLVAQLGEDAPVELFRAPDNAYITEGCVRALTEQMGGAWRHWIEQALADDHAIGRIVRYTPGGKKPRGRPPEAVEQDGATE